MAETYTHLPEFGVTLPNGAQVIAARDTGKPDVAIVLAYTGSFDPYATWSMNVADRACYSGHYHQTIAAAANDFAKRP